MASLDKLFRRLPRGSNRIEDSFLLHDERKFYDNEVYPGGALPWLDKPFDFINENPLYGKVDKNGDFLIPRHDRLAEVESEKTSARVFDFVAEAYNDLRNNILSLVRAGYLSSQGPIGKFEARKGFKDFMSMNKLQKEIHYFMFVSKYMYKSSAANTGVKYKDMVENAHDFTELFSRYLKTHTKTMPFTKTGVVNSFYMSPLSTGLCIEIDDKPYDDDQEKHKFLQDPNFNVYRIAARRYGFMVDKNVPWRLVADVRSYKMREYMRLAYERPLIEEGVRNILRGREEEIKNTFSKLPTINLELNIADLYEIKNNKWVLKKDIEESAWSYQDLENFKKNTDLDIMKVTRNISEATKGDFWISKSLYNAKDPIVNEEGLGLCAGETYQICTSRIFRFDKFFNTYYEVPYLDEIDEIRNLFYKFFLSYYVQNPITKKRVICTDKDLQTKFIVKEINVSLMSEQEYNAHYSKYHWLKIYFDIKLAENNIKLTTKKYNYHLKKIMNISTLSDGKSELHGFTTKNMGHAHDYQIDENGNGVAMTSVHPNNPKVSHSHKIVNWVVQEAESSCYPTCLDGVGPHVHDINNDYILGLKYINSIVRKKMKYVEKIYGDRGQMREEEMASYLQTLAQNVTPQLIQILQHQNLTSIIKNLTFM